jgi:hypothetical protein
MSGFLPDLASWALRGTGAAGPPEPAPDDSTNAVVLSPEQVRAQRLTRMEAAATRPPMEEEQEETTAPMDVDDDDTPSSTDPLPALPETTRATTRGVVPPKKKKAMGVSPVDAASKRSQRKKELLLKKILSITLTGGSVAGDDSCVMMDLTAPTTTDEATTTTTTNDCTTSPGISTQSIAELLATRLAMAIPHASDMANNNNNNNNKHSIIAYLAVCHRRSSEELKELQSITNNKNNKGKDTEIVDILKEIQNQVVSYAASCLMVPELFAASADGVQQLAKCLSTTTTDTAASSISFGVSGPHTSFYYLLCEELIQQDETAFNGVICATADVLYQRLDRYKSVLDGDADGSATVMVSALAALSMHKRAAMVIACHWPVFLLPPVGTPEAASMILPNTTTTTTSLLQFLGGGADQPRAYVRRSGPGLERDTPLGRALRVSAPRTNAAFTPTSVLRQSVDGIQRTNAQQRRSLRVHQETCALLLRHLLRAGPAARARVLQWLGDALLVNAGAAAMQVDPGKVSSAGLLLNVSVVLLQLCEPFCVDDTKVHLIDPGFVSSPGDHGGVFETTGDAAVVRLGAESGGGGAGVVPYNPKNRFIPQCFFLCARSLHFGIAPLLSHHEYLLRHISHRHYELQASNRDIATDPQFASLVSRQRSLEVSLYQEEMVADTLRFCNLMARVLVDMDDDALRTMPEDFVSDVCHILMLIAKLKGKLLRGIEFRHVFKMVVKLLSARYASVSDSWAPLVLAMRTNPSLTQLLFVLN